LEVACHAHLQAEILQYGLALAALHNKVLQHAIWCQNHDNAAMPWSLRHPRLDNKHWMSAAMPKMKRPFYDVMYPFNCPASQQSECA
jgi:hypothetical protein